MKRFTINILGLFLLVFSFILLKNQSFALLSINQMDMTYNFYTSRNISGYTSGLGLASFDFGLFSSLLKSNPFDLGIRLKLHYARFNFDNNTFKNSFSRFAPAIGARLSMLLVPSFFSIYADILPTISFDSGMQDQHGIRLGLETGGGFNFFLKEIILGFNFNFHIIKNNYLTFGPNIGFTF